MRREVETTVYVDLDDFTTSELLDEIAYRRKREPSPDHEDLLDDLDALRHALMGGRVHDALILLERVMMPGPTNHPALSTLPRDPETGRPLIQ